MDKDVIQEIGKLWDKINDLSRTLSSFTETKSSEIKSDMSDTWEEDKIYYSGEYVLNNNHLYICTITNQGINPEEDKNSVHWKEVNIASELNRLFRLINR